MYYQCRENKDADRLGGYREADLCLCFRIYAKSRFSHDAAHFIYCVLVFPGVPISRPQIVEMEPHKAKLSWSRVDVPAFGLDDVPLTYMLEVSLKFV